MKLTYRGVTYEREPFPATVTKPSRHGKYRGVVANYPTVTADVELPDAELTYRGVTYRIGPKARKEAATAANVAIPTTTANMATNIKGTVEECLRQAMMDHHRQVYKREQSMLLRTGEEVGLPRDVAMHFHNHIQGFTPGEEGQTYDRSHAAMS